MGAAMGRRGETQMAEFSYLRAVSLDKRNLTAMSNLARFYKEQGDQESADHYRARVTRFRNANPYYLYFEAREAYSQEDYASARRYLKRALRFKRDDADIYLALASTYKALGNERKSDQYREVAERLVASQKSGVADQQIEVLIEGQAGQIH